MFSTLLDGVIVKYYLGIVLNLLLPFIFN